MCKTLHVREEVCRKNSDKAFSCIILYSEDSLCRSNSCAPIGRSQLTTRINYNSWEPSFIIYTSPFCCDHVAPPLHISWPRSLVEDTLASISLSLLPPLNKKKLHLEPQIKIVQMQKHNCVHDCRRRFVRVFSFCRLSENKSVILNAQTNWLISSTRCVVNLSNV